MFDWVNEQRPKNFTPCRNCHSLCNIYATDICAIANNTIFINYIFTNLYLFMSIQSIWLVNPSYYVGFSAGTFSKDKTPLARTNVLGISSDYSFPPFPEGQYSEKGSYCCLQGRAAGLGQVTH